MPSLKGNVVLNFINTVTGIIFPVITFPYASRILMPEGIGTVNFQTSIINYIVLLTSLGIPMYAVREIAKYRDDVRRRNTIAVEIASLSAILCLCGYMTVWLLARYVPQIHTHAELFYILSLTILFTGIGVQWFYQGIEDFKFITIRAVTVRTLSALCLFLLVKERDDLLIYGAITVGASVGNNVINFLHLRKYIPIRDIEWTKLKVFRHLKPALHIFVLNLIISIYVNLNAVMLGFMQNDAAVGLYIAGSKLSHVILTVVTSLGVVMIPRCSNLVKMGKIDEFGQVGSKAIRLVIALALPSVAGLMLLAGPIIRIFCGDGFVLSIPVLYWTAPIIFFIGITNVIGLQVFYPQNKENIVIWSTLGGAVINLILNILLIPIYSQTGAAIATFAAELMVMAIQIAVGHKYIPFKLFDKGYLLYVRAMLLMVIAIFAITCVTNNDVLQILLSVAIGGSLFGGYLIFKKDEIAVGMLNFVLRK